MWRETQRATSSWVRRGRESPRPECMATSSLGSWKQWVDKRPRGDREPIPPRNCVARKAGTNLAQGASLWAATHTCEDCAGHCWAKPTRCLLGPRSLLQPRPLLPFQACNCHRDTHHIHRAENMAVVVAGLQVLGDVGKGTQVLWVLSSAGDVPDLVLSNDILPGKVCSGTHGLVPRGMPLGLPPYLFTSLELQTNPTFSSLGLRTVSEPARSGTGKASPLIMANRQHTVPRQTHAPSPPQESGS